MPTDRPLMVYDLLALAQPDAPRHPAMDDHWYWCRKHERAEHVGWAMDGCVRIGPFMSEGEANRLVGAGVCVLPLGMEIDT